MNTKALLFLLAMSAVAACSSPSTGPGDVGTADTGFDVGPDPSDDAPGVEAEAEDPPDAELSSDTEPGPEAAEDGDLAEGRDLAEVDATPEPAPEVVDLAGDDADLPATCPVTASDVEGPYYVAGAPWTNVLVAATEPGERLLLSGTVRSSDCSPLAGAVLDVWQADAEGEYDESPGSWRLRGRQRADDAGRWSLETVIPGRYLQASGYRPAHIHFKVSADGAAPLTTQLYFAGDPYLHPNDSCTSCGSDEPTLIIGLTAGTGADAGTSTGTWNVVLGSSEN
jgi:catechol 1,2-dioxygenase